MKKTTKKDFEGYIQILRDSVSQMEKEHTDLDGRTDISEDKKNSKRASLQKKIATTKKQIINQEEQLESYDLVEQKLKDAKEAKEKKQKEEEEQLAGMHKYFCELLEDQQLYYIQTANKYTEYFPLEGKWRNYPPESLTERYPHLRAKKVKEVFIQVMEEKTRIFRDVANSFRPQPDYILNKLSTDGWLKPQEGEYDEWFDILLYSLGGGKKENMEHLEHVIAWKYLHPEDFKIPCVIIFGEGGVGKNVFMDVVLGSIFGVHQKTSVELEDVSGSFNDLIVGKAAVFIDEAVVDNANMNKLKRIVNNPTISVNEKYGPKYEADNTPLYFAGGNDVLGAVKLAGDGSDRRWSIMKVDKTILEVINDHFKIGADPRKLIRIDAADNKVKEVLKQRDHGIDDILKDKNNVARWLNHIVEKWKDEGCPFGLHGKDYQALLKAQQGPFDTVCEAIFLDEDFTYISSKILYKIYKEVEKEENPSGFGGLKKNRFIAEVKAWLTKKRLGIEDDDCINIERADSRKTTASGFKRTELKGHLKVTDMKYMFDNIPSLPRIKSRSPLTVVK
jgi:hypothetical protein